MPKPESSRHCPVCLGIPLDKLNFPSHWFNSELSTKEDLILDYCQRCGGMWFDYGEVEALRQLHVNTLTTKIQLQETAFHMNCHKCHVLMSRNQPYCTSCRWENRLECPVCSPLI